MRVGIYNQPGGGVVGGSEFVVAVLATALKRDHEVEIIHHKAGLTAERLGSLYDADLEGVRLRFYESDDYKEVDSRNPWRLYRRARAWKAEYSEGYDLFITATHQPPPFCYARTGVLFIHFPAFDRRTTWPWARTGWSLRREVRRRYSEWEWKRRLGGYQVRLSNSDFTRRWTERWWGIDCQVAYPPAETHFRKVGKRESILSVGRFVGGSALSKRQLELVGAFAELVAAGPRSWEYSSVGGLGDSAVDRAYHAEVCREAERCGVRVGVNLPREELRALYEQSKIFWHATGYGDDEEQRPNCAEHFGIATAEAMAAGCVPVVIKRGGQPEIVQHGVSGFLWDTLDELKEYTLRLTRDDALRARMSEAARERAQEFSREAFVRRVLAALDPHLG